MWGKCINAGQSCVAPDYILCSPAIQDQLIEGLRAAVERFFGQVSSMYSIAERKLLDQNVHIGNQGNQCNKLCIGRFRSSK